MRCTMRARVCDLKAGLVIFGPPRRLSKSEGNILVRLLGGYEDGGIDWVSMYELYGVGGRHDETADKAGRGGGSILA